MQFKLVFYGEPVPAQRPRFSRKTGRAYTPPAYSNYKSQLAGEIHYQFRKFISPPPPTGSKERRDYFKANRYKLSVKAYRSRDTGDIDNFIKTVMDALKDSGLILNDSQIRRLVDSDILIDKISPRIEFTLTKMQNGQIPLAIGD